jgi:hypothetical protein
MIGEILGDLSDDLVFGCLGKLAPQIAENFGGCATVISTARNGASSSAISTLSTGVTRT